MYFHMGSTKGKKVVFKWEAGESLGPKEYEPVYEVREAGFSKLANGLYADPQLRKEERKKKLTRPLRAKETKFLIEESESGLTNDYIPSDAARLIQKDSKGIKGIIRFSKPDTKKSKPNK